MYCPCRPGSGSRLIKSVIGNAPGVTSTIDRNTRAGYGRAKKSKILLLLMIFPLFPMAVVVVEPFPKIALVGRFAPAGPISQLEMVLLSLPFAVLASVLKDSCTICGNTHRTGALNNGIGNGIVCCTADETNRRSTGSSCNGRV